MNTIKNIHYLKPYQNTYQLQQPLYVKKDYKFQKLVLVIDIDETMIHALDEKDS